jgi:hypothetical protein
VNKHRTSGNGRPPRLPASWIYDVPFDSADLYGREPVGSMDDLPDPQRTRALERWRRMMCERGPSGQR